MYIQIHPNRERISDPKRFEELYMIKDTDIIKEQRYFRLIKWQ